jgi:hypothetical protein
MSFEDHHHRDCYEQRIAEPFDQMLSAAWSVRPLPPKDLNKLTLLKLLYIRIGGGLSNDELAWLTKLARKGGWKPAKAEDTVNA